MGKDLLYLLFLGQEGLVGADKKKKITLPTPPRRTLHGNQLHKERHM